MVVIEPILHVAVDLCALAVVCGAAALFQQVDDLGIALGGALVGEAVAVEGVDVGGLVGGGGDGRTVDEEVGAAGLGQ